MTRYWTFEPYIKQSVQSHEHATIRLAANGAVSILSREKIRSVQRKWDRVGTWFINDSLRFTENSFATRLVATQLEREGWSIEGLTLVKGEYEGKIVKLDSDGRTTNPDSIQGRIRKRSCELGKPAKADRVAYRTNAKDMFARLERIKLERDTRKAKVI